MLNSLFIIIFLIWLSYLTFLVIKIRKKNDKDGDDGGAKFKAALTRFNPFGNVGGDQSFCLALLIRRNLGIIITSLHGRNGTRIYAREFDPQKIDKKKMSPEEKEAIKKALKIEKVYEK